jgi:hypothetical protein
MSMTVESCDRLSAFMAARRPLRDVAKLNSSSPLEEQEPQ